MKKILFVLSLIMLSLVNVQAQKARLGIKGGANFANTSSISVDGKTGFHAGVYAEFGIAGISILPEVIFSSKGDEDLDLSYVEVPILLKKNFLKIVNIHLGPQFGFLTTAEIDGVDLQDELNNLDVSAVFGAGVNLPGGLTVGGRYVLGLSKLSEVSTSSALSGLTGTEKNKTFQIYIGYKLFGE